MTQTFYNKVFDNLPAIRAQLQDGDGEVVDLDGATVVFSLAKAGVVLLNRRPADIIGVGTVEYEWETGALSSPGRFTGEFEVTFSDGTVTTYPNSEAEELFVEVEEGL